MSFLSEIKYLDVLNIKNNQTNNIVLKLIFITAIFNLITPALAAQRSIINSGFEDVSAFPGGIPSYVITPDANIPGWNSTSGNIEVWRDGFQAKLASAGTYFIELNPNVPIGLYQDVCLVNGETLSWTFDHAARTGGTSPQTIEYEVVILTEVEPNQTLQLSSVTPTNNNATNNWSTVSDSAVYTGPTGIQRLQFRSTNAGSFGNFLDNIQITLVPELAFNPTDTIAAENISAGLPSVFVTGEVQSVITVILSIDSNSTATEGSDFDLVSSTITIPVGTYDGVSASSEFLIPITVYEDAVLGEPDETILINLVSGTAANPIFNPILGTACAASPTQQIKHTIIDPVMDLTITKTVNDTTPNIGDTVTFSLVVENLGPNTATDISVTDIVPAGFTYVTDSMTGTPSPVAGITANQSNPDSGTGLTWTIDSLTVSPEAASSITLTFQAEVNAP